jgi:hypothetical protein
MKKLKKLAGKMALTGAGLLSAAAVVMADPASNSSPCPSCSGPTVPCCQYYQNGKPISISCCREGESCLITNLKGKALKGPFSAEMSYGKVGCQPNKSFFGNLFG